MASEEKRIRSAKGLRTVERVRNLTEDLPEVTEAVDKFGHTSFLVRDKPFIMMGEGNQGPSMAIKTTLDKQRNLIEQGDFVRTKYIGQHGWVSLDRLPLTKWDKIEHLIAEAYVLVAPKSLGKKISTTQE